MNRLLQVGKRGPLEVLDEIGELPVKLGEGIELRGQTAFLLGKVCNVVTAVV